MRSPAKHAVDQLATVRTGTPCSARVGGRTRVVRASEARPGAGKRTTPQMSRQREVGVTTEKVATPQNSLDSRLVHRAMGRSGRVRTAIPTSARRPVAGSGRCSKRSARNAWSWDTRSRRRGSARLVEEPIAVAEDKWLPGRVHHGTTCPRHALPFDSPGVGLVHHSNSPVPSGNRAHEASMFPASASGKGPNSV